MKKHEFFLPFGRFFTRAVDTDFFDQIAFRPSESFGDEDIPALTAPADWGPEAVAIMATGACQIAPADLAAIEENTVPSWLWRRQAKGNRRISETDLRPIIERIVGAAAAFAWKNKFFSDEKQARTFYDEARFALIKRHIAIDPAMIRDLGLDWAYGLNVEKTSPPLSSTQTQLSNGVIDALVGKSKQHDTFWKKLFSVKGKAQSRVDLRFGDVAADWHSSQANPARASIDLMAVRHNDGSVNIEALRQVARLLTILLDLHGRNDVTISFANLAPLLLALGLSYDSDAGRAMAASLASLVTAECYASSAEMASLRGPSAEFSESHDHILRALRNHRRAAYGDANDYERLSVLPAPLALKHSPDLTIVAEAQRRWDEALHLARTFGLRTIDVTDMTASPTLAMLTESASQGLEPMRTLTHLRPDELDVYRSELHPSVNEALARLTYPRTAIQEATLHIAGSRSLRKTPSINAASLRTRGIDEAAFEKIESYLPCVNDIRLAVTPWIIGPDYCRTILKISARTFESPRFDLLGHLGFSKEEIAAANLACYGHNSARTAKMINLRHRPLFASGDEISIEARLRMSASVQSFISGDTGVVLRLPASQSVERGTEIALSAWQRGLKSLTLIFDPEMTVATKTVQKSASRRIKPKQEMHTAPNKPQRRSHSGKIAPASSLRKIERRLRSH